MLSDKNMNYIGKIMALTGDCARLLFRNAFSENEIRQYYYIQIQKYGPVPIGKRRKSLKDADSIQIFGSFPMNSGQFPVLFGRDRL
jgi:hypothetical protein